MRERACRGGEGGGAGGAACVVGEGVQGGAAPRVRVRGSEGARVHPLPGCFAARRPRRACHPPTCSGAPSWSAP
eukprot:scaffold53022_cov54-Phaeocystis_antarctica.AAC.2